MTGFSIALLVLTALGALYYVLSTCALVSRFRKRPRHSIAQTTPKVSILKPVSGLDHDASSNFDSYVNQDYGDYEVLFGVLDSDDPSVPVIGHCVRGLRHAALSVGAEIAGSNNKVRILHNLAKRAGGDILVVTDADTRVTPDFLKRIVAPFENKSVGVVTCMYRGIQAGSAATALEGLYMTSVFAPGAACADCLGGIDFALGAAVAIRKTALIAIGGFESIADYLADDFQLGRRAARAGFEVKLSDYVVDVVLSRESLRSVLARELRWCLTTKASRPWGHLGLAVTYGFAYSVLFLAVSGFSTVGWSVLAGVAGVRTASAWVGARKCLGDREFAKRVYLLPACDLLCFGIWIVGYFSRTVQWRGRRLRLARGGKIEAAA